jgi:hypothetical protein
MGKAKLYYAVATAFLFFCLVASASADTVSMTFTSAGSNILDNSYVGPYTGTINGVTTLLVCDDYADNVYQGENWTANVTSLASSNLSATKWGNATGYGEAAWLTQQMFSGNYNSTQIGELQYALWDVFDPQAFTDLANDGYSTQLTAANTYLSDSEKADLSSINFSNFTVYTPTSAPPSCGGSPCESSPPQEFITYTTPEAPMPVIFLADLLLLGTAVMMLRRRGILFAKN